MKFFAVFSALLAVACAGNTWTPTQLGDAIQSPYVDPALKPYLEAALNDVMAALWAGEQIETVAVTIPSMDFSTWTVHELGNAIENPETDPALIPYLEVALNEMMESLMTGNPVSPVAVSVPAMELQYYSLNELSMALQNPTTNPQLIPYLEPALNEMMEALYAGQQMTFTVIAVPAGLNPVDAPAEINPIPVDTVSVPNPASPASPLVQIIININQQETAALPVDPIQVVENAPIEAEPVEVIDVTPVIVEPVQVVDNTPVIVKPVQVADIKPVPAA